MEKSLLEISDVAGLELTKKFLINKQQLKEVGWADVLKNIEHWRQPGKKNYGFCFSRAKELSILTSQSEKLALNVVIDIDITVWGGLGFENIEKRTVTLVFFVLSVK